MHNYERMIGINLLSLAFFKGKLVGFGAGWIGECNPFQSLIFLA
jgi:hypothetical protein